MNAGVVVTIQDDHIKWPQVKHLVQHALRIEIIGSLILVGLHAANIVGLTGHQSRHQLVGGFLFPVKTTKPESLQA